jgi:hypothetical protein
MPGAALESASDMGAGVVDEGRSFIVCFTPGIAVLATKARGFWILTVSSSDAILGTAVACAGVGAGAGADMALRGADARNAAGAPSAATDALAIAGRVLILAVSSSDAILGTEVPRAGIGAGAGVDITEGGGDAKASFPVSAATTGFSLGVVFFLDLSSSSLAIIFALSMVDVSAESLVGPDFIFILGIDAVAIESSAAESVFITEVIFVRSPGLTGTPSFEPITTLSSAILSLLRVQSITHLIGTLRISTITISFIIHIYVANTNILIPNVP